MKDIEQSCQQMCMDEEGKPYVMWGNNKITLETGPVTDKAILEKAEKELREIPEIVEKALNELRNLLKGIVKKM